MEKLNEYRKFIPTRYIYLSFLVGLLFNLIPLNSLGPDVIGLLLLYWLVMAPEQVGLITAFVLGVIMDVATFSVLGQHSLAYTVTSFALIIYHRRILLYDYVAQTLVVLGVLLVNQLIISLVGYLVSKKIPPMEFFFPVLVGALLWPLLNKIMIFAYRPRFKR